MRARFADRTSGLRTASCYWGGRFSSRLSVLGIPAVVAVIRSPFVSSVVSYVLAAWRRPSDSECIASTSWVSVSCQNSVSCVYEFVFAAVKPCWQPDPVLEESGPVALSAASAVACDAQ